MKSLPKHVIPQVESFEDPYNLGATFLIARTNHPKSGNSEVEKFITEQSRQKLKVRNDAMDRARKTCGASGNPSELLLLVGSDQIYIDEVKAIDKANEEKAFYLQEENAISYIRGWSGSAFDETELPKNGAFSNDDVRKHIFECHGPWESEDVTFVARFREIKSGEFVYHEDDRYRKIEKIWEVAEKECIKVQNKKEEDMKKKYKGEIVEESKQVKSERSERESTAIREEIIKIREEHTKKCYDTLKKAGYEEVPHFGNNLRVALAMFITEKALELEELYAVKKGRLSRN